MAVQTRQIATLLRQEGAMVELVQANPPYPKWIARARWVREPFRLLPYLVALWRVAGKVQLFHIMANSRWSWHLIAAPAIWVGKLRGISVVVNYRGGAAEEFFARSFRWVKPSLLKADAVVVPSAFLEQVFAKRNIAVRIVPNIVDLDRFSSRAATNRGLEDEPPHILVARNLEPIYDVSTALRAFGVFHERLPKAKMTIAGSGSERRKLEALAKSLGVESVITFAGQVDNADMAGLYRSATMMVNPSLVDNMPISILESMASGVPVVSTNVGGVPYLVRHGEMALLVPPGAPQAMADAMLQLATDKALARRLAQAGQMSAQAYAWPNVRDKWLEVYASVMKAAPRAASREVVSPPPVSPL
jgi:phenylacetate-CoA ligase